MDPLRPSGCNGSLYTIPRGIVGPINDAIRQLEHNPTPPASEQVDESLYRLPVGSYVVMYNVDTQAHKIVVLLVEPTEDQP